MQSRILQQDHQDLIKLNQSLSPEERLIAFYHHSFLMAQLALAGKVEKRQDKGSSTPPSPPSE